jgi:hypothetical protein
MNITAPLGSGAVKMAMMVERNIANMCIALGVSPSGYGQNQKGPASRAARLHATIRIFQHQHAPWEGYLCPAWFVPSGVFEETPPSGPVRRVQVQGMALGQAISIPQSARIAE